jgi:hypothetical protein
LTGCNIFEETEMWNFVSSDCQQVFLFKLFLEVAILYGVNATSRKDRGVALFLRILKFLISNLVSETGYLEGSLSFLLSATRQMLGR